MTQMKSLLAALTLAITTAAPASAQLTIGAPATGANCFPFGCGSGAVYQQVYSANSFSGLLSINSISFFTNLAGSVNFGTFSFYLSTTPLGLNVNGTGGISNGNFDGNRGLDNALFATLNLQGQDFVVGERLDIVGTPFLYDPSAGNLLLDIRSSISIPSAQYRAYFDARNGDATGLFSRAHDYGSGFTDYGLVTEFNGVTATVPEPGSVAMVGAGLLAMLVVGTRRRQTRA